MADAYSILPLDAKPHLGGTPSLMRHRILMLWDIAHLREVILPRIGIRDRHPDSKWSAQATNG